MSKPVAVCTNCGSITYSALFINQRCGKQFDGKRCKGIYGSALNVTDWEECPSCQGQGSASDGRCETCQGSGWLFVRKGP